jgi:DNA repair protein RadC
MKIKDWSDADKPREKLEQLGKNALSDAELLAIVLGSGSKNESALDLSKRILKDANHSISTLSKYTIKDLQKYKGIGAAKAIGIVAALELGNRKSSEITEEKPSLNSSQKIFQYVSRYFDGLQVEHFYLILLNRSLKHIKTIEISVGGTASTIVDAKIIMKHAIENLASIAILAHNHPSGNKMPSSQDDDITNKLKNGFDLFDIKLIDHIIYCGQNAYYSYADEGRI